MNASGKNQKKNSAGICIILFYINKERCFALRRRSRIIDALFLYVGGNGALSSRSLEGACGGAGIHKVGGRLCVIAYKTLIWKNSIIRERMTDVQMMNIFTNFQVGLDRLQSVTRALGDRDIENTVELNR
uniref:Uncharacterized protein n=1 Tax=Glossina austeni TaxID=7395 RepID=A0A1A9VEW6_GLOAU